MIQNLQQSRQVENPHRFKLDPQFDLQPEQDQIQDITVKNSFLNLHKSLVAFSNKPNDERNKIIQQQYREMMRRKSSDQFCLSTTSEHSLQRSAKSILKNNLIRDNEEGELGNQEPLKTKNALRKKKVTFSPAVRVRRQVKQF